MKVKEEKAKLNGEKWFDVSVVCSNCLMVSKTGEISRVRSASTTITTADALRKLRLTHRTSLPVRLPVDLCAPPMGKSLMSILARICRCCECTFARVSEANNNSVMNKQHRRPHQQHTQSEFISCDRSCHSPEVNKRSEQESRRGEALPVKIFDC